MRLLVIGESGQLARALAPKRGVTCVGRAGFDLSRASVESAQALLRANPCDAVINAAGYTQVDSAESNSSAAYALNETGPRALAQACAAIDIPLVHISTDYVFDGRKAGAYVEDDPVAPRSVYGASKAAGERAVREIGVRAAIVRTSWLYSAGGSNFARTMLRLAQSQDEVRVVNDQHGAPTWVDDLADASYAIAARLFERDPSAEGIFHFANSGATTWAGFAEAVFEHARARSWPAAAVTRITTAEFPTAAPRPQNSRLDMSKYAALIAPPRPWQEALTLCMKQMTSP